MRKINIMDGISDLVKMEKSEVLYDALRIKAGNAF